MGDVEEKRVFLKYMTYFAVCCKFQKSTQAAAGSVHFHIILGHVDVMMTELTPEDVILIPSYLDHDVIQALSEECDFLRVKYAADDPLDRAAALDPFEYSNIPPHSLARSQASVYFQERLKAIGDHTQHSIQRHELIACYVEKVFPALLCKALQLQHCMHLYLFNEHYVVKDRDSDLAFRWHRDVDEQLAAVPSSTRPRYYSMWCNLDEVSAENGTISFDNKGRVLTYDHMTHQYAVAVSPLVERSCGVSDYEIPPEDGEDDEIESVAMHVPPGSIVIFASSKWHRSGINTTNESRRVYYVQYSVQPVVIGPQRDILSYAVSVPTNDL